MKVVKIKNDKNDDIINNFSRLHSNNSLNTMIVNAINSSLSPTKLKTSQFFKKTQRESPTIKSITPQIFLQDFDEQLKFIEGKSIDDNSTVMLF